MGLVATLNAIDTESTQFAAAKTAEDSAQATKRASRQSKRALEEDLDDDIREVNLNGLGTISAGFLDAVGAGQSEDFSWTGGSGNRRNLVFSYDKDSDTLSGIRYVKAAKDKNTGDL